MRRLSCKVRFTPAGGNRQQEVPPADVTTVLGPEPASVPTLIAKLPFERSGFGQALSADGTPRSTFDGRFPSFAPDVLEFLAGISTTSES
jgi:hypothetical protein